MRASTHWRGVRNSNHPNVKKPGKTRTMLRAAVVALAMLGAPAAGFAPSYGPRRHALADVGGRGMAGPAGLQRDGVVVFGAGNKRKVGKKKKNKHSKGGGMKPGEVTVKKAFGEAAAAAEVRRS